MLLQLLLLQQLLLSRPLLLLRRRRLLQSRNLRAMESDAPEQLHSSTCNPPLAGTEDVQAPS